MSEGVTPADLRKLASAAEDLALRLDLAQASLAAGDNWPRRRVGYPLAGLANQTRRTARTLAATADKLARTAALPERDPFRAGPAAIRDWARANGYPVVDRGRVPDLVLRAYYAAHLATNQPPPGQPATDTEQ